MNYGLSGCQAVVFKEKICFQDQDVFFVCNRYSNALEKCIMWKDGIPLIPELYAVHKDAIYNFDSQQKFMKDFNWCDLKQFTPGPWFLRISVVRFSLVRIFKK